MPYDATMSPPLQDRRAHFNELCDRIVLFRAFERRYRDGLSPAVLTSEDVNVAWCALGLHRMPVPEVKIALRQLAGIVC